MAITNFIRTVWSARLTDAIYRATVYAPMCNRDWEQDVPGARTVKIGQVGAVEVRNYQKNTDITIDNLDDSEQELVMDQAEYFAFQLDDVDKAQSNAPIMEAALANAARAIALEQDDFLKPLFRSAKAANTHTDATTLAATADGYLGALGEIKQIILDDNHVIAPGDINIVIPPVIAKKMENQLTGKGFAVADAVLQNGLIGQVEGINIRVSTAVDTASSGGKTYFECPVTVRNVPVTMADQVQQIEAGRMEKRFSDFVKGLWVYGAKVVKEDSLYKLRLQNA